MRPTPALLDIAKRALGVDERTGRHLTDGHSRRRLLRGPGDRGNQWRPLG